MDVLKPKTIAVLAALAFLIAGAVYLIGQGGGNPDGAPAGSAAAALDAAARGEVANFTLGAFGLPTTLLISPQGEEIGRMVGPAPWASEDAKAFIEEALRLYAPSPNS